MATVRFAEKDLEATLETSSRYIGPFNLKKEQREAIISFVCLPTGYGKSLCECRQSTHSTFDTRTHARTLAA